MKTIIVLLAMMMSVASFTQASNKMKYFADHSVRIDSLGNEILKSWQNAQQLVTICIEDTRSLQTYVPQMNSAFANDTINQTHFRTFDELQNVWNNGLDSLDSQTQLINQQTSEWNAIADSINATYSRESSFDLMDDSITVEGIIGKMKVVATEYNEIRMQYERTVQKFNQQRNYYGKMDENLKISMSDLQVTMHDFEKSAEAYMRHKN